MGLGGGVYCLGYTTIFFSQLRNFMAYLYSSGLFKLGILGHSCRAGNRCVFFGSKISCAEIYGYMFLSTGYVCHDVMSEILLVS